MASKTPEELKAEADRLELKAIIKEAYTELIDEQTKARTAQAGQEKAVAKGNSFLNGFFG